MRQNSKIGNAKACEYCGEALIARRSTKRFCTPTHRKLALDDRRREARRRYQLERRSSMSLVFDGRVSGTARCAGKDRIPVPMTGWFSPFDPTGKDIEDAPNIAIEKNQYTSNTAFFEQDGIEVDARGR